MARWQLYDPTVPETYVFPVNPNEGGTPNRAKRIDTQVPAAPDGKVLLWEGRDEPQKIDIKGVILEQAQLDAFNLWFNKRHQVRLTDDLGRQYWVYMTTFNATRNRRVSHPWHHSYDMSFTILDNP